MCDAMVARSGSSCHLSSLIFLCNFREPVLTSELESCGLRCRWVCKHESKYAIGWGHRSKLRLLVRTRVECVNSIPVYKVCFMLLVSVLSYLYIYVRCGALFAGTGIPINGGIPLW